MDNIPLDKLSKRYFFETDILFRLNILRAVVKDIPMQAIYGDEESHFSMSKNLLPFLVKHCKNTLKRIFYSYFLRDFHIASLNLVIGVVLVVMGSLFGIMNWLTALSTGIETPTGTIMFSVLPIMIGVLFCLSFLHFDIANEPRDSLQELLED